jgi:hypothetical protein
MIFAFHIVETMVHCINMMFEYPSYLKNHIDTVHHGFYNVKSKNHSDPDKNDNDSYLGHNGQDAIECRSCLIQFKFPSIYIKHYQEHHNSLPPEYMDRENFMCDQCPSVFISKSHLNHHIKRVHLETLGKRNPDFVDSIPCSSCPEKFSAGNLYIRHHQLVHGGIPPEYIGKEQFMCEECPSIFMEKHRLNTHKKSVHSKTRKGNKKELKCRFCEKKYNYSQHLKEHILQKHEKSTPFTCDQCTRSFGMKSRLKAHKRLVHERVQCDECNQEICNSFELKRHKAKVHGIKPSNVYQCEHCPMFFFQQKSLNNHTAKIHPEK